VVGLAVFLAWRRPWAPSRADGRIRLVVLPFENLGAGADEEHWADGLTEDVITQLARLQPERLAVIARTSAMHYKGTRKTIAEIGRELGVEYVIEGSVRRAGHRLRLNLQLVQVSDQSHVWAEKDDRDLEDALALPSALPRAVGRRLGLDLPPAGGAEGVGTRKPEAYEAYLRGRHHLRLLSDEGARQAVDRFEEAVTADPAYASAYAGLAEAHYALSNMRVDPREAMERARAAAQKALVLDEALSSAHSALGLILAFYDWDWPGAEREFRRALALDPAAAETRGWFALHLAQMGRLEQSTAELQRARKEDPLSLNINSLIAFPLYLGGRYDEAVDQSRRALELDPRFYLAQVAIGAAYEAKGDYRRALAEMEKARRMDDSPEILAFLARAQALAGETAEARRLLGLLKASPPHRYVSPYDLALVHDALGERDDALRLLEQAYEAQAEGLVGLQIDPRLRGLRSDPRFQELLLRMNFPR
jgi:TolB-like protein/Flp pilus assembly protein TadD